MDKALFLGMNAQSSSMHQLEILTNNLANINTPGFRADYEVVKQNPISNNSNETRVYSSIGQSYTDFKQGPILRTGKELDLAISGDGFFAVQSKDGREGYTRSGNFMLSTDGYLVTQTGQLVLGRAGAIRLKNAEKIEISNDGTVSARFEGSNEMVRIGNLKLVTPPQNQLMKGKDGLFYVNGGAPAKPSKDVKLITGAIEGSNVNPIDTLTKLIDVSRSYEIHSNFIRNLSDIAAASNKLLDSDR